MSFIKQDMGKYFRDISIQTYGGQVLPNGKTERDFNISVHNVQDMFFYMIPRPFEFRGITKLNILITNELILNRQFALLFDGIVEYNYPTFDFNNYFQNSQEDQNGIILDVLRKTIKEIGGDSSEESIKLLKVCDKIEELNFELEWESKKLTKQTRNKKYKASVVYKVNSEGQNAFIRITDSNGQKLIDEHLVTNIVYEFTDSLYKSTWDQNKYKILDRYGQIFKEYKVDDV